MNDDLIKRLHKYAPDSLDGNLRGPALEAAAALTEAQATIARLRSLVPNPDETPDEILWRDYMRGVHPDMLAKQRKVTRERMRHMLRRIEERRAALSPREGEGA